MRIAMIGGRGVPAGVGGVERVIEELSRELTARGHKVLVYGRADYVAGGRSDAGRSIVTPGLGGKHAEAFTHTATAAADVLRRRVDVVHFHSPGPALWSWLPSLAGRPVVFTVHAADWRREKWSAPAKRAIRAGLWCGMRFAREVTCVSRRLTDELTAMFGRKVRHVPNAVRPAAPAGVDVIRRRWGLKADGYVLHVGRIVPEKRLDALLGAWADVGDARPLVVVGSEEGAYAARCRRDAPDGVVFVGPQTGRTLAELYANAALVVQPSALEGMSMVVLEAASHGRCVLVGDIPEMRAELGDALLYCNPEGDPELAREIRRLLQSEETRREQGQRARERVASGFTWTAVADAVESIYRRAAGD